MDWIQTCVTDFYFEGEFGAGGGGFIVVEQTGGEQTGMQQIQRWSETRSAWNNNEERRQKPVLETFAAAEQRARQRVARALKTAPNKRACVGPTRRDRHTEKHSESSG